MDHTSSVSALTIILVILTVFLPVQTEAITNGSIDTNNTYSNVGIFVGKRADGLVLFRLCSGTLVAPTIFLTAAHCVHAFADFLAPQGFTAEVSFDNPIPLGSLTDLSKTHLIDVSQMVADPNYVEADNQTFHPQHISDPGDIAVLILPSGSTAGITPAALPTLGVLDQLAAQNGLHDAVFTVVGYGTQGGGPFIADTNPAPRIFASSTFLALNPALVNLSENVATGNGGPCVSDSGGPNFLQVNGKQTLVATTSIRADSNCVAMYSAYRLDTKAARQFLGGFVALP
jgi:Trypsin